MLNWELKKNHQRLYSQHTLQRLVQHSYIQWVNELIHDVRYAAFSN